MGWRRRSPSRSEALPCAADWCGLQLLLEPPKAEAYEAGPSGIGGTAESAREQRRTPAQKPSPCTVSSLCWVHCWVGAVAAVHETLRSFGDVRKSCGAENSAAGRTLTGGRHLPSGNLMIHLRRAPMRGLDVVLLTTSGCSQHPLKGHQG